MASKGGSGTETQRLLRVAKEEVANGSASSDQEERVTRRQDGHARGAELRADKSFKERLKQMKDYKERHGSFDNMHKIDSSLNDWCSQMRSARRGHPGNLPICNEERIKALNALKFDWNPMQSK